MTGAYVEIRAPGTGVDPSDSDALRKRVVRRISKSPGGGEAPQDPAGYEENSDDQGGQKAVN